ncbi:MAG: endolytic transglycosylase MltG [Candidatus Marinimicrobia bacterium]|nr:endolytic transglycosylase MltG [Candidatus Neomarinimicrobiota bacterium]
MDKLKVERIKKFLEDVNENNYVFVAIILVAILVTLRLFIIFTPVNIHPQQMKIIIPKGANLSQIANQLADQGILNNPKSFVLAAHLMLKNRQMKAGFFNLQDVRDYRSLIRTLSTSQVHTVKVMIPEGYQAKQIAQLVASHLNFEAHEFIRLIDDKSLLTDLGIESPTVEGYLFPETYYFNDSDTPEDVIRRMIGHFNEMVTDSVLQAINASRRTLHEVLTLASIVEGECMVDDERPLVASVYVNRLKKRMRLESDPTIQYIIPDGPRRLLKADLEIQSPYNTYRNRGLPPGPINNPGIKSILAATWPAETGYLYMVAVGDGTHSFHNDYDSFLRAKRQFQRVRRQVARNTNKGK